MSQTNPSEYPEWLTELLGRLITSGSAAALAETEEEAADIVHSAIKADAAQIQARFESALGEDEIFMVSQYIDQDIKTEVKPAMDTMADRNELRNQARNKWMGK